MVKLTTAADMAQSIGVDPNAFRQALRVKKFPWQKHNDDWQVKINGDEHSAMRTVLVTLLKRNKPTGENRP